MDVGEDNHEDLWREALNGCSIVVCGAEGANVRFVLGYRIACCSVVTLAKEAAVLLIRSDP